ncbi:MAG TPA: hypothetical protein VKW04_00020 [Planctomycetota bacterium]|nr:hypothetical protein [Planctomycetota bacterium]
MDLPAAASWLGPLRPPPRIRDFAWDAAAVADRWSRGARGVAGALAAGTLPVLISLAVRLPGHQIASALGLGLLCLACVRRGAALEGIALALLAFAAHSVVVMLLAAHAPDAAARLLPGAAEYWLKQREWIRTGWDPEYETAAWTSSHLGQLGGVIVYSYASLGWITFAEGFREVDWMNYYCVQLMRSSTSPLTAGLLGWHVWSLVRGVGLAVISIDLVSLSLGRLTGRELSTARARRGRWIAGLGLLALDAVLKVLLLRPVQEALLATLR